MTFFQRQLFDSETNTFTYLIADPKSGQALLIDPVLEQVDRDLALIDQLGFKLAYVLETHVHADHITAAAELRKRTGARTAAHVLGAECADIQLRHKDTIKLGDLSVVALATPGHTDDSMSFQVGEHVFTGDTLFVRGTGRADFQNGDPIQLWDSITRVLFKLPDSTQVWPGHDYKGHTSTTIGEEKQFNPRLANKSQPEFVDIMNNLGLPAPRKLAESVPANRRCGQLLA
jgi:glyoxylase-like metal-dependent hydrolase (beta-lactamase superfamily II)